MNEEILIHILESNEAILVQLMRLYDVAMTQLAGTHPDQAAAIEKLHEAGRVISSMPMLVGEEENE